jgi:hypothetical protein
LPWQAFQSQLFPHVGSQNWPGHQGMGAPGSARASVAAPTPANPKPAAITVAAIAQLANLFMPIWISGQTVCLPSRPLCSDEQLQAQPLFFIPSCCSMTLHV